MFTDFGFRSKVKKQNCALRSKKQNAWIWKKGTNTHLRYKLEEALAKRYCKKGFLVYSDMHKDCKKCRPK